MNSLFPLIVWKWWIYRQFNGSNILVCVLGIVKFAASRSRSKFVIGREGWNGLVVNKLMYGCGPFVCSQNEFNDLEVKQNEMGRWLWDVVNVKNERIRGETGCNTFQREKQMRSQVGCCELCLVRIKCLIWLEHVS